VSLSSVKVFAPATVANVASGFDVLGFALEAPGDAVSLRRRDEKRVEVVAVQGDGGRLPLDPARNPAAVSVSRYLESRGWPFGVDLVLEKGMPPASGLGSSAASAVAGVVAANLLAEQVACGAAHADNVAPALLGGFVLIRSYEPLDIVRLPVPEGLAAATAHPHTEIRTEDARRILKKEVRLADAVRQWGNLAALVAALYEGDLALLGRSLQDVVAEPRRALLIPGFAEVKAAALEAGALGCSISGSGPTGFALCSSLEGARRAGQAMQDTFRRVGLECDLYLSAINRVGPVCLQRG